MQAYGLVPTLPFEQAANDCIQPQLTSDQVHSLPPPFPREPSTISKKIENQGFQSFDPQTQPSASYPVKSRRFRSSIRDIFLLVLSALLLSAFLAASAYLVHERVFLPIDFWQRDDTDWLASGGWNVFVTVLGSLLGAIVAAGISSGIKNVIRLRILSSRGLPLIQYETLCKLSMGAVQWDFRFSAVYVLALFILVNQLSAATQAAFGTTPTNTNYTYSFPLGRLNDNGDTWYLTRWASTNLPYRGEFADAMGLAVHRDNLSSITGDVDGLQQTFGGENAILAVNPQADLLDVYLQSPYFNESARELMDSSSLGRYTALQGDVLRASPPNAIFRPAEGFLVSAHCNKDEVSSQPTLTSDGQSVFMRIAPISCPDDTVILGPFRNNTYSPFVRHGLSSFFCVNTTTPTAISFALLNVTSASVLSLYQCQVAATSAIYDTYIDLVTRSATPISAGREAQKVEASVLEAILQWQGEVLWNQQAGFGIEILRELFYTIESPAALNEQEVPVLERIASTVVGLALAKLADLAHVKHTTYAEPWTAYEESTMILQTSALKMHLAGSQRAWNILPALLLLIILGLLLHRILYRHTGDMDFADPVQVMLIGLSSPEEQHWQGCSMGHFEDGGCLQEAAIHYGVDPRDADRLVLSGTAGYIQRAPKRGAYYR